jgi:hypothetical protein
VQEASEVLVFLRRVRSVADKRMLFTYLVELHELLAVHLLVLVQRDELDLLRRQRFVREGALDRCFLLATMPCIL